jgi:hypothetical protein
VPHTYEHDVINRTALSRKRLRVRERDTDFEFGCTTTTATGVQIYSWTIESYNRHRACDRFI